MTNSTIEDLYARLAAAGITPDDLGTLAAARQQTSPTRTAEVLMHGALKTLERDHPGAYKTWVPYLKAMVEGFDQVCPCSCAVCCTGPCPCAAAGHHDTCVPGRGETINCADRYRGVGDSDIDRITKTDLADLAYWARRRALQRTVRRNINREKIGKPPLPSDGRGAAESAIAGARWFFKQLNADEITQRNPAAHVKAPARQERPARSLDASEFLEIYRVAITTGTDPELDGLLLRHQLIQAVRRGGLLQARAGGVDPESASIHYWDEKRDTYRNRPSTRAHVAHLMAHMLERGPRVAAPADAPEALRRSGIPDISDTDPVFYRKPVDTFDDEGYFVSRTTLPVTRKRIESLFARLQRHVPWAWRRDLRPHDIRHTSGRLVYQASDDQMARLHLAHDAGTSTDHYLREHLERLARLKESLFGLPQAIDDEVED